MILERLPLLPSKCTPSFVVASFAAVLDVVTNLWTFDALSPVILFSPKSNALYLFDQMQIGGSVSQDVFVGSVSQVPGRNIRARLSLQGTKEPSFFPLISIVTYTQNFPFRTFLQNPSGKVNAELQITGDMLPTPAMISATTGTGSVFTMNIGFQIFEITDQGWVDRFNKGLFPGYGPL